MDKQSVVHNTFVIERSYPVAPAKVFAAFADPSKKQRWFLNGQGHEVKHYEMDFRVGGKESAGLVFKEGTPVAGMTCTSETIYEDIVPNQRVVFASKMNIGGKCISAALGTVELLATNEGTDVIFTHQAAFFEGADGPEMRQDGWRKLLDHLERELGQ